MRKLAAVLAIVAVGAAAWWGYRAWRGHPLALRGLRPAAAPPAETVPCLVWFPSRDGLELCEEAAAIPKTANSAVRLREILDILHRGPATTCSLPLFPGDTAPRAVFLTAEGTAYLDYPAAVFERPLGIREEFLFIRALSRSILRNCPDVRAFVILVDGSPRDTISAHLPAHGKYLLPAPAPKRK